VELDTAGIFQEPANTEEAANYLIELDRVTTGLATLLPMRPPRNWALCADDNAGVTPAKLGLLHGNVCASCQQARIPPIRSGVVREDSIRT
jgi:hypothetical protein